MSVCVCGTGSWKLKVTSSGWIALEIPIRCAGTLRMTFYVELLGDIHATFGRILIPKIIDFFVGFLSLLL